MADTMHERILIVDDERELLENLHDYLSSHGYATIYTASNLAQAKFQFRHHAIDLIILDLMLPDGSGLDFLKDIRQTSKVPVIILSALDGMGDMREGFGFEADDYIVKPFLAEDLLWRVQAVLRRTYRDVSVDKIALDGVLFDRDRALLIRDEEEIALTAKQFKILDLLAEHLDKIVSIDQILEEVWDDPFGYENTLVTHIYRLREKLEDDPSNPKRLVTVKGLGYKLVGKTR